MLAFLRRLIQSPGLAGHEAATAALVRAEMQRLGYDDVWADEAGNIIGRIQSGPGASVMLNTHLDHVDVGDPALWPYQPFAVVVAAGAVWGRGSMDIKGP